MGISWFLQFLPEIQNLVSLQLTQPRVESQTCINKFLSVKRLPKSAKFIEEWLED
jgi:hypothetical protein